MDGPVTRIISMSKFNFKIDSIDFCIKNNPAFVPPTEIRIVFY